MANLVLGSSVPGPQHSRRSLPPVDARIVLGLAALAFAVILAFQLAGRNTPTGGYSSTAEAQSWVDAAVRPNVATIAIPTDSPAQIAVPVESGATLAPTESVTTVESAVVLPETSISPIKSVPFESTPDAIEVPAVVSPAAAAKVSIRTTDFGAIAEIAAMLDAVGGSLDLSTVRFADLTDDGLDEALVPVSSGGTMGNVAYFVVSMRDNAPVVIFELVASPSTRNASEVNIEAGNLVETTPVYAASDPLCCPSAVTRAHYEWNGTAFVETQRETVALPRVKDF